MQFRKKIFHQNIDGSYLSIAGRRYHKDNADQKIKEYLETPEPRLGTPYAGNDDAFKNIKLTKVSHKVTDIEILEDGVYVTIETLGTPDGKLVESLLEHDIDMYIVPCWIGENIDGTYIIDKISQFCVDKLEMQNPDYQENTENKDDEKDFI